MGLQGDEVASSKLPQSVPQKMVDEEYPMHLCMYITLVFSSHSHQV